MCNDDCKSNLNITFSPLFFFFFFCLFSFSRKGQRPWPKAISDTPTSSGKDTNGHIYNIHHPELIKEKFAEIIALNVSGNTARGGKKGKVVDKSGWMEDTLDERHHLSPTQHTSTMHHIKKRREEYKLTANFSKCLDYVGY